jgi:molybdate transport system ATP-binding protein
MAEIVAADSGLSVELHQAVPVKLDVAFSVAAGEFMALVGPSGSGKTTILRSIAGLHRPATGRIAANGVVWFDHAVAVDFPARRRRVGFVFQSYALFPHLTAVENVLEALQDRPHAARQREARALLARLHLDGLENRRPASLSGGEQQRVAVARALARRPEVLLLDEPFSAVDRAMRKGLYAELAELRSALSMPIILVTHDLDEAAQLADTATVLAKGEVVASGPMPSVFARSDLGASLDREAFGALINARIEGHDPATGTTSLVHPAGRLFHPLLPQPVGTLVRLRIRARDVALAVGEPGRLSIRNRLAATVVAIAEGTPPIVEVRLAIAGEALIANITRDAVRALDLRVGSKVTALIKSAAFDRSFLATGDPVPGRG